MRHATRGQSLIELLVGIALGGLFIIGSATIIAPSLKSNTQVTQIQEKTELGSELMSDVRSWAVGDWNGVLTAATGSANEYYLVTTSSPFTVATGSEAVSLGSSSYARFFYLSDMYRDTGGNATTSAAGTYYDPSTKQVTVVVSGPNVSVPTSTYTLYITRNASNITSQNDWSGGGGVTGAETVTSSTFASSINITNATSGVITLTSLGGSCKL